MTKRGQFLKLGFAELDAGGLKFIDDLEQLFVPADELSASVAGSAIVLGQFAQRAKVLGRGGDVPRPTTATIAAIGQDGALVKFAARAPAGGIAAFSAQSVKRARQDRFAAEAFFEEARQELLRLEELCAKGAELMVHGGRRGKGAGLL